MKCGKQAISAVGLALGAILLMSPTASGALVAYWSFEDLDATDESGNGFDGMLQGSTGFSGDTPGAFSLASVSFSAAGDRVFTVPINNFGLGTGDFTVLTFVKRLTTSKRDELLGEALGPPGFRVELAAFDDVPANTVEFEMGGPPQQSAAPIVNDNQWHLLAIRRQGGLLDSWVDGALSVSVADATNLNLLNNLQAFSIGSLTGSNNNIVGFMDDVAIYNTALNDNDLSFIQNNGVKSFNQIPEPLTILGTATAAGFGAFFKRQINKKKKDNQE